MASNPPFEVEDQTDEDFFDKLVEDEEGPIKPGHYEGNDSDDAKAFANLSLGDTDVPIKIPDGGQSRTELRGEKDIVESVPDGEVGSYAEERNSLVASNSVGSESVLESSNNDVTGSQFTPDLMESKSNESINSGIKEVSWNSFYADSKQNGGMAGGSYSDFFNKLGGDSADFPGEVCDNVTREVNSFNEVKSDGLNNSITYLHFQDGMQYQQGQGYETSTNQSINGKDMNSSQYLENLYPGWRYNSTTGQWYQIDDYNATAIVQETSHANYTGGLTAASDQKAQISYIQQTAQSVQGTITETGPTESIFNSNQASKENNGYPEHMIFDPQYPDWYYDTIAQEWRLLKTYNLSIQTSPQGYENGYALASSYSQKNDSFYNEYGQSSNDGSNSLWSQDLGGSWNGSYGNNHHQGFNTEPAQIFSGNEQHNKHYGSEISLDNDQQHFSNSFEAVPYFDKFSQAHAQANGTPEVKSFVPGGNPSQQFNYSGSTQDGWKQVSNDYSASQKHISDSQQPFQAGHQFSFAPQTGRLSAGRPPHALVTFSFGGKLIVMKDSSSMNSSYGNQGSSQGSVSVLNLMEVVMENINASGVGTSDYFHALCQQSFPGPLVGGNVGNKELYKWIEERISNCESPDMDYKKSERLRLLLSLLKVACQHYGKLRSPFGTDTILKENDNPESAVAKLFASAKRKGALYGEYSVLSHCLQNVPSEGQLRATASEMQSLLVSGRKKDALQCAQEGQLWGPALILASQLGDKFHVDTVKQMALRQLVAGSPLRTLCLLIAGQPAEVFSVDTSTSLLSAAATHQHAQCGANGMLDDWEENLAVITANRTKDDELVIIHLGDCLWKERSEIAAAHICYLVAEANFESYSDSARLCLIGADHWKFPRTYASPDAIQRTELYEYSKVLGNSQFILLPFQPYKLIYAYMLAEVGKVSDSLRYCQALMKSLKTGRVPEVEAWKQLVLSLEERIRTHQQGGYTANLAPAKLVGKLLNFFDSTAHRVVGGLPPPAPSTSQFYAQGSEQYHQPIDHRVPNSQSTMAMSSLIPSASMEPISEWTADNRMTKPNRSVSEPDIGRTPRQETTSTDTPDNKASVSARTSRFSRFGFGSQLIQKTVGLVLRPKTGRQAKLGETNKFYYDETLKRWVEEGAELPAEEVALPPPPITATFQNSTPEYNLKSALKTEGSILNENPNSKPSTPADQTSGTPPIPPSSNQFSARGRMGVRSRYVDTFNQGGGNSANLFQSPSVPSVKPAVAANAKFFIPTPASSNEQKMESISESVQEDNRTSENPSTSTRNDLLQFPTPPPTSMQRFSSMGDIKSNGTDSSLSRRTASWSGCFNAAFSPPKAEEVKPLGEASNMPPSSYMPNEPSMHLPMNGEDLHEVEL